MWSLRVLSGEQTGETFKLTDGDNHIGRTPNSRICLSSAGVSKQHALIKVNGNALAIKDLGSSNGTFVNGLKINQSILQVGDRIAFHNILCEIQFVITQFQGHQDQHQQQASVDGNLAQDLNSDPFDQAIPDYAEDVAADDQNAEQMAAPKNLKESFMHYIDNVMLPGVYKLAKIFELKMVLFSFVLAFILVITALSTIPMLNITKDTIQRESGRRALGIARSLVRVNSQILSKGFQSQLTTRFATREEGVEAALIISAVNGSVIAPASEIGAYKNLDFIHTARKIDEEYVANISSKLVGASVPIRTFDPKTGNYDIRAYAVVLYNMGKLAIDDGRTVSLFMQTLLMAIALGSLLFFFMYKLIERPFVHLSRSLDDALKGDPKNLEPEFIFPALEPLYTNINSLVQQGQTSGDSGDAFAYADPMEKQAEAKNLCSIISNPAMAITTSGNFLALNAEAESFLSEIEANLIHQPLDQIYDESLKLSLQDLLQRTLDNPNLIQSNQLEFSGINMEIDAQGIGKSSDLDYILICFNGVEDEEGGFE